MASLISVIEEAKESLEDQKKKQKWKAAGIAEMRKVYQAVRTKTPKAIAVVKEHLDNMGEFELYEFLQNCEFWEVRNKNAPNWYRTAGVRPANNRIEFYYDADFIQKIAKKPGLLVFLIAHEASHIFRFHIDRAESQGKDHTLSNIAQDAVINHDIMATDKIGGWKPEFLKGGIEMPKKFLNKYKDKKNYYYEFVYDWMLKNKKELEPEKQESQPLKSGDLVRVKSGPQKGEYREIVSTNKDGTHNTKKVDINEIVKEKYGDKVKLR